MSFLINRKPRYMQVQGDNRPPAMRPKKRQRMFPSTPSITISLGSDLLRIDRNKTQQLFIKGAKDAEYIPVVATNKSTSEDFIVGNHPNGGDINSKDLYKYYRIEQDQNYNDKAVLYEKHIKVQGQDPNWTPVQVNFDYRLIGGVAVKNYYYPSVAYQTADIGRAGAHYIWRAQSNIATSQSIKPHETRLTAAQIFANPRRTTARQKSMLKRYETDSNLLLDQTKVKRGAPAVQRQKTQPIQPPFKMFLGSKKK